jgi:hypothetical protein
MGVRSGTVKSSAVKVVERDRDCLLTESNADVCRRSTPAVSQAQATGRLYTGRTEYPNNTHSERHCGKSKSGHICAHCEFPCA